MKFKVIGKSLILSEYNKNIYEGENEFDNIEITVPRRYDDHDLTDFNFRFTAVSVGCNHTAMQILSQEKCDDKYIYLKGKFTSNFTCIVGTVKFILVGISQNKVTAKFISMPFSVTDDLSLNDIPPEAAQEQIYNEIINKIQAAKTEIQNNFVVDAATENKIGGILSGGDISVAGNGSVTVNSINGKTPYDDTAIKNQINEIAAYIGYTDSDIIGLHADFENSIFTRLGAAVGLNSGSDFDKFPMYGGRKRCNVLDDGTITAYYGDSNFVEDGSNGQVMVYQPKFYYKVVPLKLDPITDGCGYHLRNANYFISAVPKNGFKLHPAFYDESGNPVDYILFSAYEGSIFDTSENIYLKNDEQVADFSADILTSIANVKPCSGTLQNLTRANIERLAKNRGKGWHCDTIKAESANQMLMIIEFAKFNMQEAIGLGVVSINNIPDFNCAVNTGKTSTLGNTTGSADGISGQISVSYRGMENPWGNMWKFVQGININVNGTQKGGVPYICNDFDFNENKTDGNYFEAEFTLANISNFISSFGYSENYDWLFLSSESKGNSVSPIGDLQYTGANFNGCKTALLSGYWQDNMRAGAFCMSLGNDDMFHYFQIGSRLTYFPESVI